MNDLPHLSFLSSNLYSTMHSPEDILRLAKFHAQDLQIGDIPPFMFLMSILKVESDLGQNNTPRFEPGYSRMSIAYRKNKTLQDGYTRWGDLCAMSWGPAQILWIVAKELGYDGHPADLWSGVNSLPYAVQLINKNFKAGANTMERLAATYNGGLGAIKNPSAWPQDYIRKFVIAFSEMKRNYSS